MSTLRQIEANRRNAKKSTGPTSVTGKAASSMNALKTGIHADSLVLPIENSADLEALTEDYYRHCRPASPIARAFVDDLIRCEWHLRRFDNAETQMWEYQNQNRFDDDEEEFPLGKSGTCNSGSYSKLQYRIDATRRARLRALQALENLQAAPAPAPAAPAEPVAPLSLLPSPQTTSPQIGFVPSSPAFAPPQPEPVPTGSAVGGRRADSPPLVSTSFRAQR
jgi:hypothetical protein